MSDMELQSRLDALAPLAVLRLGQILTSPHADRRHRLTALCALLHFAERRRDAPGGREARSVLEGLATHARH